MIVAQWRQPDPPILTQWRGPDARIAVSALSAGAPQVAALIGPPGLSPLSGQATIDMEDPGGVYEQVATLPAAGVTPAHRIFVALAPTTNADENSPELIDLAALSGAAGSGTIGVTATFSTPVSGPLILNWSAF